jgi:predicted Zn-dependent protease
MLAAFSPEDPEYLPPLGPQTYLEPKAYDTATAEMPAAARAQVVAEAIAAAKGAQLVAAGIYRNSGVVQVLANSAGLFGYFPWSRAAFSITTRTSDGTGSGYAALSSNNAQSIDCKEAAGIAVKKALDSRGARELPPGAYPAILEPQGVADISSSLIFALNARLADEGRSVFSAPGSKTRIGEKIFDPRVHIQTDPQHPVVPGSSFSAGGLPTRKADLIREGVLENLTSSRYWATQKSRQPGPFVVNLVMDGEGTAISDMIKSTERGILLTRLWYVRPVDPQQALVTGLTRDGTFFIENGKIAFPIKNFRFNESLVRLLGEVEALGTPQRVQSSEGMNYGDGGLPLMLPAMKVKSFRFTSLSDAV